MAIKKYQKIVTPFLMGQRKDGLLRVQSLTTDKWGTVNIEKFQEVKILDRDEQIERMGEIYFALSEKIKQSVENGYIPISLAGDCVSSIGVLAGLQKAGKEPNRIIWLDAHGDFHTWDTSQTKYIGGMPLAMLVGHGDQRIVDIVGMSPYPEDKIILSDARDLDSGEKEAVKNSKMIICEAKNILKNLSKKESVYLHWDTDFVSAEKEMPALKYHVKSGLTYPETSDLFKSLKNANIVAISISAWHEEKDLDNKTAEVCLSLLDNLKN